MDYCEKCRMPVATVLDKCTRLCLSCENEELKEQIANLEFVYDGCRNHEVPELEEQIRILKTPHEWQPGDEGWYWGIFDNKNLKPQPFFIHKGMIDARVKVDAYKKEHGIKHFYRAVLPEVTHENSD